MIYNVLFLKSFLTYLYLNIWTYFVNFVVLV